MINLLPLQLENEKAAHEFSHEQVRGVIFNKI